MCLTTAGTGPADICTVTLNGLTIGIDEKTGSIVTMQFPPVGEVIDASHGPAGILDLAYPIDVFAPMRMASRFSKARVVKEGAGISITWDRMGPSRSAFPMPDGKVSAEVRIEAAPDGRSVIMSCRIDNNSQAPVRQVLFPDFWGLTAVDGPDTVLRLSRDTIKPFAEPIQSPECSPFYVYGGSWNHYPASSLTGQNPLRWLDYGSLKGGLSVFHRKWGTPDQPGVLTQRREVDPMRLRLLWEHQVTIEPGQRWESGEFWLTPHPGGWAKGIEPFRNYVNSVNPPREIPHHIRDGLGFQTIWMIQTAEADPEYAAFRFSDLPHIAREAAAHGLSELNLWGYCNYSTLPISLRSELGTREEFLGGVRKARELGVNITQFISVQFVRNKYADKYGAIAGDQDWTYHHELIPNFRPYYTKSWDCASVQCDNMQWQRDVQAGMTEWIDAGAPSFCWDVFGVPFSGEKNHSLIALIERIRETARARDPESTFGGESITVGSLERDGAVLDYLWNWVDYHDMGPILNVLRAPRPNCNIEESLLVVKKAFSDGLYINLMPRKPDQPNGTALLSDKLALSASVKQCAALRKQFLPYFTEGTFIGNCVLSRPVPAHVAAHQMNNKLLIIVLNDLPTPQVVSLESDLDMWLPPARCYEIRSYDGFGKLICTKTWRTGAKWTSRTCLLQPLDMAIFVLEAATMNAIEKNRMENRI